MIYADNVLLWSGERFIELFSEQEATQAFYALHSKDAIKKLKTMRPQESKDAPPSPHPVDVGWFLDSMELLLKTFPCTSFLSKSPYFPRFAAAF